VPEDYIIRLSGINGDYVRNLLGPTAAEP